MAKRRRSFTPICPSCGSVRCADWGKQMTCQDCGHSARAERFSQGGPGTPRSCNTHWRDPVALSMDGYDDGAA